MVAKLVEQVCDARRGFTYEQVARRELPFDWELIDGRIIARGRIGYWHRSIRESLVNGLERTRRAPYAMFADRCLLAGESNATRPDIVVVDESRADTYATEYLPTAAAVLVVEIVSTVTQSDDWFRKPQLYAAAGIANFWRVERSEDDRPIVYQYWLDHESASYVPAPANVHTGTLTTAVPYPVRIDLSGARICAPPLGGDSARLAYRTGGARSMRSHRRCPECGRG